MLTASQTQARRSGLGGSDAAAVLGVHPYRSPLDVYLDKLGLAAPFEGNEATRWGDLLEDVIAREYAERTGQNIARTDAALRHPKHEWMLANPDRIIVGRSKGVEIKNVGARSAHRYGDGPEDCAEEHICQSAWYMAVTDTDEWDIAVLVGGQRLRIYTIRRDLELEQLMIEAGERFWFGHVQAGVLPPVDGSESFKRYLAARYPRDTRPLRAASAEEAEWMRELAAVHGQRDEAEARAAMLENRLKSSMGDAGGIFADERKITWKADKNGRRSFRCFF